MGKQTIEATKIYIRDAKVKAFREAGGGSLSAFCREKIDEYLESRAGSPNTSPEQPPVKEGGNVVSG